MPFFGIDRHARQITVSLRNQKGDLNLARQVSPQPEKILDFFDQVEIPVERETCRPWVPYRTKW